MNDYPRGIATAVLGGRTVADTPRAFYCSVCTPGGLDAFTGEADVTVGGPR